MRFTARFPGGATTANPRTDPDDVVAGSVLRATAFISNTDTPPRRTMLALEGSAGNTATVQLWVRDTKEPHAYVEPGPGEVSGAEWYELGVPVALTVGEAAFGEPIPEGQFYLQVTVASAAASEIKLGPSP
jgi:hypothetical protein